jgi:DNA-3-methyladenine glycosylase II
MSQPKVRYVQAIAELAGTGGLDRNTFDGLDDETAIERLMEIPGVGRWTAEMALMRGLGRSDVFPAGDLGLTIATQRLLRMRARPTERQIRSLTVRWQGWRSYVALYLWASLATGDRSRHKRAVGSDRISEYTCACLCTRAMTPSTQNIP